MLPQITDELSFIILDIASEIVLQETEELLK